MVWLQFLIGFESNNQTLHLRKPSNVQNIDDFKSVLLNCLFNENFCVIFLIIFYTLKKINFVILWIMAYQNNHGKWREIIIVSNIWNKK
jgi:hypothetical protein